MKGRAGVLVHLGVLALATALAGFVWTRDDKRPVAQGEVEVWPGRASDVTRIALETKRRTVVLESRQDEVGRFFIGRIDKDAPAVAGAAADAAAARVATTLVSVGTGEKLAESFSPLRALRALGRLPDERLVEFGLDAPEGEVIVTTPKGERRLALGGTTPGGGDRYVRETSTQETFVVKGDLVRDLEQAESRLVERDLHEWKERDVKTAKVSASGRSRELSRGGVEGKMFWADPGAPEQNDETAGNWMAKLDRLRPTEFVVELTGGESVVRVDYAGPRPLGFVELVKVVPVGAEKAEYYVRTERTRLHGKVPSPLAEPVEQDLGALIR